MKKVDNLDLIPLKVTINCTNDIAYMDCALLLDKPEFLKLLPAIREEFGITKLVPYKDFYTWKSTRLKEDLEKLSRNEQKAVNKFIERYEQGAKSEELFKLLHFSRQFEWRSQFLARNFNRPGYFDLIIQYAIVCGEVGDGSYEHTRIEIIPSNMSPDDIPLPEVAIVITPMTTMEDIKKIFENNIPQIFEDNEKLLKYFYRMKKDPAANIRRDREWYWRNLAGEGYTEIALSITSIENKHEYETHSTRYIIPEYGMVREALRRYKKLLKVYI